MRQLCLAGGLLVAVTALTSPARGDLVFFKDGFVLQGKVRREGVTELDSITKEFYFVPKGFFVVDDGPRRVYFSPRQVSLTEKLAAPNDETVSVGRLVTLLGPQVPPPVEGVLEATPWNLKTWERDYFFRAAVPAGQPERAKVGVRQMLATINPYFARVDAITRYKWHSTYLLKEWDAEATYKLVKSNKYFNEKDKEVTKEEEVLDKDGKPRLDKRGDKVLRKVRVREQLTNAELVERRFKMVNFCTQAGWYDLAEAELAALLKDFPTEGERVNAARRIVGRQRARDAWERIKLWHGAGRTKDVTEAMASFPMADAPDKVVADLREMKSRLESQKKSLEDADQALSETIKLASSPDGKALALAGGQIRGELHIVNVERLEAFLSQYREAGRHIAKGKKPPYNPDELLALAVSGFLLGSPSAVPRTDAAVGLWETRRLILNVMATTRGPGSGMKRQALIDAYVKGVKARPDMDEVAQMIDFLPPFDAAKDLSTDRQVVKAGGEKYHLKLPPAYTHNRPYPVLIVVPDAGENGQMTVDRWARHAADHGYILAVPERGGGPYRYTAAEHDCVLEALRDLRRRYHADSDRVYLAGLGEGGKAAFDIGLSHPDLFAGVLPMCAGPMYFPRKYWRNAQFLPFYIVMGTRVPDFAPDRQNQTALREQFTSWVQNGYNALWVEYKGRGVEWLGGELDNMFDWMRFQKRALPMSRLGSDGLGGAGGEEFTTHRLSDNRFYWLTAEGLRADVIMPEGRWQMTRPAATLTARINQETNTIIVKAVGVKQLTISIVRNSAGQHIVDLDRPVTVTSGLRTLRDKHKVVPSLKVLLEDLHERMDRRHLVIDKIVLTAGFGG
jgi:pimeloyl-ACP methyl ester carboxylesterase